MNAAHILFIAVVMALLFTYRAGDRSFAKQHLAAWFYGYASFLCWVAAAAALVAVIIA